MPRAALERLAREIPPDRESFERVLALQPWRLATRRRTALADAPRRGGAAGSKATPTAIPKYDCPMNPHPNSFGALDSLRAGDRSYAYFRLDALERAGIGKLSRLPFSLKILLENLLRFEDGRAVKRDDIEALAR